MRSFHCPACWHLSRIEGSAPCRTRPQYEIWMLQIPSNARGTCSWFWILPFKRHSADNYKMCSCYSPAPKEMGLSSYSKEGQPVSAT